MLDLLLLACGTGLILLMAGYAALCDRIWPMFDLTLGAAIALFLLVYLVWALLRPEDF